jgi:glycosyltransferase involved in cell wall biosynthesis
LILFTEYYTPAHQAGGPITSIKNLYALLQHKIKMIIVCSAYDLNATDVMPNITLNQEHKGRYYTQASFGQLLRLAKWIFQKRDEVFYINGLYTWHLSLLPALLGKELIIAPRGMLQKGAMEKSTLKKRVYLNLYKFILKFKKVNWHATDEQEQMDIIYYFNLDQKVSVIPNIVKIPVEKLRLIEKPNKTLKLISLSLITSKKNTFNLIRILQACQLPIELDLYGPIKDATYWEACQQLIASNTSVARINYKGMLTAEQVPEVLQDYHASILLSKGENFGHAIFESLALGRPVILSDKTPWRFTDTAGACFGIEAEEALINHLHTLYTEDQAAWEQRAEAAWQYAQTYMKQANFEAAYTDLFQQQPH